MRPLIITDDTRARIAEIVAYAEANVEPLSSLVRRMGDPDKAPGAAHFDQTTVIIPMGYRCCFTIEQQPKGNCRHISISVPVPGKYPNEHAVFEIMRAFGFDDHKANPCHTFIEEAGECKAVNVIQRIK